MMLQENVYAESKSTSDSVPQLKIKPLSRLENLPTPFAQSELSQFSAINDQPRYSYNRTYLLAKKIGFPAEFAL